MSGATGSISTEQLKEILAVQAEQFTRAIAEMKKPTVLEQKELDRQERAHAAKQIERKNMAEQIIQKKKYDEDYQKICSHKHPAREGGHSHGVLIVDRNFILCQQCQVKIRPGTAPEGYKGGDIYSQALFNQVLQDLQA